MKCTIVDKTVKNCEFKIFKAEIAFGNKCLQKIVSLLFFNTSSKVMYVLVANS